MIIAISGRIGSGKDTVSKIIQHLTSEWADEEFQDTDMLDVRSNWKIKKFAGKLKQIVSILTGIPVEDLEKQEVKEKELGKEWWYYTNTLFNTEDKELVPYLEANKSIHNSTKWYIIKLTPRKLLQLLGTECGRNIIHPNVWVNALFSDYKDIIEERASDDLVWVNKPNWIITDLRFPNELKAVKDKGGITIRVVRPGLVESNHLSEVSLDSATFDFVINNDKDIEHLINEVRSILVKEQII